MTFSVHAYRFTFRARDAIHFPQGKSANILRGAFGLLLRRIACLPHCPGATACPHAAGCAYARLFEPHAAAHGPSPSGLTDWPRPFVFRATHLDGLTIPPGAPFHFDLHVFDLREPVLPYLALTFTQLARDGLGPGRGRADLITAHALTATGDPDTPLYDGVTHRLLSAPPPLSLPLEAPYKPIPRLRVSFVTPTELKDESSVAREPHFPVLFGRLRDRISTLRALYQDGPLDLDFRAQLDRTATVRLTGHQLHWETTERRSSRTGQTHPLGGFTGWADYEGELAEFVPYVHVGRFVGVGRQTVWGKGEVLVSLL